MSKADKMFEALGYKKMNYEPNYEIAYVCGLDKDIKAYVVFSYDFNSIQTYAKKINVKNKIGLWVNEPLYLAIHEKMKELGWIE